MESDFVKDQLIKAIKSLNVNNVRKLVIQDKSTFTTQDKQDIWNSINNHPVSDYCGKAINYEYNTLVASQVAGFFAICTFILWLFKDGKVPPITEYHYDSEKNSQDIKLNQEAAESLERINSLDKPKKINYPKTFMSHFNHYHMRLINLVKNGAKYTCGGIAASATIYGLVQYSLLAYHSNYYKKFHLINKIVNKSLPENN